MSKQLIKGFPDYRRIDRLTADIESYADTNSLIVVDIAFGVGVYYFHAIVTFKEKEDTHDTK